MNSDTLQIILRNIGTLVAGYLITRGYAERGSTEIIIGAVVAIGMAIYSWWSKRQAKERASTEKAASVAVAVSLPSDATPSTLNKALAKADLPPVDFRSQLGSQKGTTTEAV